MGIKGYENNKMSHTKKMIVLYDMWKFYEYTQSEIKHIYNVYTPQSYNIIVICIDIFE